MMESINIFIENLVEKGNEETIRTLFEKYLAGKSIAGDYEKDSVPEEKLLELLECSVKDERIRCFLIEILFTGGGRVNADSISDKVFEYCLGYPPPFGATLLVLLAHMPLKAERLERLNRIIETPEAFLQLFLLNLRSNDVCLSHFRDFLLENAKHLRSLANFREHTEGQSINRDKIDLTNRLVRAKLEECIQTSTEPRRFSSELFLLNLYDDNLSVSQFHGFMLANRRYYSDLMDRRSVLLHQGLCREKLDLADQLLSERLHQAVISYCKKKGVPIEGVMATGGESQEDEEDDLAEDAWCYDQGRIWLEQGKINEALESFRKSLELRNHFKTLAQISVCYDRLGLAGPAFEYLELAYKTNPRNDKVAYDFAEKLKGNNRTAEAKEVLESLLLRNQSYKKARILLRSIDSTPPTEPHEKR